MKKEDLRLISLELVKEALEKNIPIPLKTFGLSMGDTIQSGEWVTVRKVTPSQLRFGDIVIFQSRTQFVCHRLIRKKNVNNRLFVLPKGDAHIAPDGYIPAEAILARVTSINHRGAIYNLDTVTGKSINILLGTYSLCVSTFYGLIPGLHGLKKKRRDSAGILLVWLVYTLIRFPAKIIRKLRN